jgi:phytoene dehydrogenase-like protein
MSITRRKFLEIMTFLAGSALVGWTPAPGFAKGRKGSDYDAVVIGAGLGGLATAALMARHGLRPLVLEQHDIPGGYATSFARDDDQGNTFTCEVSLHSTVAKAGGERKLLEELGVFDRLTFVDHKLAWSHVEAGGIIDLKNDGLNGLQALLVQKFPADTAQIAAFMTYWRQLATEMERLETQGPPADKAQFPQAFPAVWFVAGKTLKQVLDHFLANTELKNFIGMTWGYYGLPPSKLAAFYYLLPMADYLTHGGQYIVGTSQALSNAITAVITQAGGTVLLGERVDKILLQHGRAAGVRTQSGKTFTARAVVSNASAPATFSMLPGAALPQTYTKRLDGFTPSISSMVVWLGLDREVRSIQPRAEFNIALENDPEAAYAAAMAGDFSKTGVGGMIYDNLVPGFSPKGKSTLCIMSLSGYEPWRRFEKDYDAGRKDGYNKAKDRAAEQIIATTERTVLPGLSKMIVMRESATPLTNRRFTCNPAGAIYGYDQTADNSFLTRLKNRTPVPGLYLASAWTSPGGGYGGALLAGKQAFKNMVEDWG